MLFPSLEASLWKTNSPYQFTLHVLYGVQSVARQPLLSRIVGFVFLAAMGLLMAPL
jgi:hypothetical protein